MSVADSSNEPSGPLPTTVQFGPFEADLRTQELRRSGRRLRLPNQSFVILAALLERPGQPVTREELRSRIWPTDTFIDQDQALNAAVNRLREALGDRAEAPKFVETVPRRGYQFIATIDTASPADAATPSPAANGGAEHRPAPSGGTGTPLAAAGKGGRLLIAGAVIVIVGAMAVLSRWSTDRPTRREVVPFTSLPGQEISPTFSPDGSEIAFAWNGETGSGQLFDLYVKSIGSERLLRLTNTPSTWISPAWSPDGSQIAFARVSGEASGVFVIAALGGPERRLTRGAGATGPQMQLGWSPDGTRIAYSQYDDDGAQHIHTVALNTLKVDSLPPIPECRETFQPAFSPDGRHLALICGSAVGVYSIYMTEMPHGRPSQLTSQLGYPQGLAWAADGTRLILANDSGNGGALWELTTSGRLTQLAFGENGTSPAVAPRGHRMAYVRGTSMVDIWRVDLTAPHPETAAAKLIYSTRSQIDPQYSPDGSRIAFQSNRSGSWEIWMADAQGRDPVQLTSFGGAMTGTASWCSDGHRIAFDSRASGQAAIYVEDINERVPREVQTTQANLALPVWSEDCRWLFASDRTPRLYRIPASGGPAALFSDRPSYYASVAGPKVIFNVEESSGVRLWSKPADGGPEEALSHVPLLRYTAAWFATRAGIYYTEGPTEAPNLFFHDLATHTTRRIMTLPKLPAPGGGLGATLSPDGRWFLYTQTDEEQSDILLVTGDWGASP